MKGDFLSFRVAAGRAVLGLVLQAAFAAVLLVYAFLADDHAGMTAAAYAAIGIPVWLALAIVYDQHRRERIEAMEAETLAEGVGRSSVFEADSGDFRVARSRLNAMYKFLLPSVSVLVGAAMIAVGAWRFLSGREIIHPDTYPGLKPGMYAWGLGVGAVVAFVGFIFARYISGMAKQPVWQNLRGGAAWTVGTSLMGFLIGAAQAIDLAGPDVLARWIVVVFPVVMVVLGVEVFFNFLLDLYRPRRAGEVARPAFDSRVLGFVAAPDRIAESISDAINYQLGFNVSSTWFYQLLSRSVGRLVLLGLGVLWLLSCLAVVQPHERAMVLRFGRPVERDLGPGLHLKLPWPIDRVEVPAFTKKNDRGRIETIGFTATGVRTVDLGTPPPAEDKKAILWTNEHAREEVFQIVQPSPADAARAGGSSGPADLAMVSAEIPLQYAVRDVALFDEVAPVEYRDELLKSAAQREIVRFLGSMNVDDILGGDQTAISAELRRRVTAAFAGLNGGRGAGVEVLFVGITDVHPPKDAAANFERVVQAEQVRQAKIEVAQAEAIESLTQVVGSLELANRIVAELNEIERLRSDPDAALKVAAQEVKIQALIEKAGGNAAEEVARARADRWVRHMTERGRAARYQGQLALHGASPRLYEAQLYFDALKAAMEQSRVYIVSDKGSKLWFNFDLADRDTSANVLDTNREKIE